MSEVPDQYERSIRPHSGVLDLDWKELWDYRELLYFLSLREIKIRYKQSIMGIGWAVLQPLFTMVVFTLIFSRMAQVPSEGVPYPVFSYSGLLLWIYFQNAVNFSSNSLVSNQNLLTKVYFPRLFIPTAPIISGLLDYGIAFSIVLLMMVYYVIFPTANILLVPVIVILTAILALGVGCILSSICVKYRDVQFVLPFFVQIWMFLSPVIYPSNILPGGLKELIYLNPMTGLINAHRACLLGYKELDLFGLGISTVICIAIFCIGVLYLRKTEKYFADVV